MIPLQEQFLAYWRSRSARDQRILAALAGGALLIVLYAWVWLPITQARVRLRAELPQLRAAAEEMTTEAQEIQRLKAAPRPAGAGGREAIEKSAEAAGIRGDLAQIITLGPDRVQVVAPRIAFDRWVRWVKEAQTAALARVESAQVSALAEPGQVKAQAVFVFAAR